MKSSPIPQGFLLGHPLHFIALGFGSGLSRVAPGTVGTLVGFPLFLLLGTLDVALQWVVIGLLFAFGCHVCEVAGRALGVPDHGGIVWDEIVAYCMVLMTVPHHWIWWVAAFAAFRFFDILKPWPIGWLDQRFKNGFGVMVDDLMAAVYAMLVLAAARIML